MMVRDESDAAFLKELRQRQQSTSDRLDKIGSQQRQIHRDVQLVRGSIIHGTTVGSLRTQETDSDLDNSIILALNHDCGDSPFVILDTDGKMCWISRQLADIHPIFPKTGNAFQVFTSKKNILSVHNHPQAETFHVIYGKVKARVGPEKDQLGDWITLEGGAANPNQSTIHIPPYQWHEFKSDGRAMSICSFIPQFNVDVPKDKLGIGR